MDNFDDIVSQMSDVAGVMDKLVTKRFIDTELMQEIDNLQITKKKARRLVTEMEGRPEEQIRYFIDCLQENHRHLHQFLMTKCKATTSFTRMSCFNLKKKLLNANSTMHADVT